jgi:hypothetical protein
MNEKFLNESAQAHNDIELTGPADPENEEPVVGQDHGASKVTDLREGKIEATNTPVGPDAQAQSCEFCGRSFERRKGGGSKQRFCGTKCRQDFHAGKVPGTDQVSGGVPTIGTEQPDRDPDGDDDDYSNEFNWNTDDSVVLPYQQAVAIYFNHNNELVIRQEKAWNEEDDHIIIISEENVQAFLDKLTDACGIPSFP